MRFVSSPLCLALLAAPLAAGCFGSHGGGDDPDAGPGAPPPMTDSGSEPPPPVTPPPLPPAPEGCFLHTTDEVFAPTVVFDGQPLTITMRTAVAGGCDCQPEVLVSDPFNYDLAMCDCCEACRCIDQGYEVTWVGSTPPGALDHTIFVVGEERTVYERDPGRCHRLEPTGLWIEPPRDDYTRTGPRTWWAVVSGEEFLCCASPMPGVTELAVGALGRHLELRSCALDPCDCDCGPGAPGCEPTRFEAWYPLGDLSGGEVVVAGSHRVTVEPAL